MKEGKVETSNLIVLDFPTGMGEDVGKTMLPPWNDLTEDNLRYGIVVAIASLANDGRLVLICPFEGTIFGSLLFGIVTCFFHTSK